MKQKNYLIQIKNKWHQLENFFFLLFTDWVFSTAFFPLFEKSFYFFLKNQLSFSQISTNRSSWDTANRSQLFILTFLFVPSCIRRTQRFIGSNTDWYPIFTLLFFVSSNRRYMKGKKITRKTKIKPSTLCKNRSGIASATYVPTKCENVI